MNGVGLLVQANVRMPMGAWMLVSAITTPSPYFIVHHAVLSNGETVTPAVFCITHVKSGTCVCRKADSLADVFDIVKRLMELPVNWDTTAADLRHRQFRKNLTSEQRTWLVGLMRKEERINATTEVASS